MATKEQIWAAANSLTEEGKTATLAAVREQLGGGSYTDISAAMQLWRSSQRTSNTPLREPAPPSIAERLNEFGGELWATALELANGRLQSEREALEQARQETEEIRKETANLADQLTSEIEQLKTETQIQKEQLTKLQKEAENARVAEQSCQARLEASAREIESLKVQVKEEREEAKKSAETAAELRGRLGAFEEIKAATDKKATIVPKVKPTTQKS